LTVVWGKESWTVEGSKEGNSGDSWLLFWEPASQDGTGEKSFSAIAPEIGGGALGEEAPWKRGGSKKKSERVCRFDAQAWDIVGEWKQRNGRGDEGGCHSCKGAQKTVEKLKRKRSQQNIEKVGRRGRGKEFSSMSSPEVLQGKNERKTLSQGDVEEKTQDIGRVLDFGKGRWVIARRRNGKNRGAEWDLGSSFYVAFIRIDRRVEDA